MIRKPEVKLTKVMRKAPLRRRFAQQVRQSERLSSAKQNRSNRGKDTEHDSKGCPAGIRFLRLRLLILPVSGFSLQRWIQDCGIKGSFNNHTDSYAAGPGSAYSSGRKFASISFSCMAAILASNLSSPSGACASQP